MKKQDVQPRCTERQGDSATWFSDFSFFFFFYHGEIHVTRFTISAISECTVWQRPSYQGVCSPHPTKTPAPRKQSPLTPPPALETTVCSLCLWTCLF